MADEEFMPLPEEPEKGGPEQFFTHLAVAATIDGKLGRMERALLGRYAVRLKLDEARANEILGQAKAGTIQSLHAPKRQSDKERLFRELARVVAADGVLTPKERSLIDRLKKHLGVPDFFATQALEKALEEQKKAVAPKDLPAAGA